MTAALVRSPVNSTYTFHGQRQTVMTSLGVAWMSVTDGSTAYLYYWNGTAWVYSGVSQAGSMTALALDPVNTSALWWACLASGSVALRRLDLAGDHKSVSVSAAYTVANSGSSIGGFDMVVTPAASGTRKLHLVWGRYYSQTSTSTTYGNTQHCSSSTSAGHNHGGFNTCPCDSGCTSSGGPHTHDGFASHSHSWSCGAVIAYNDCVTGTSSSTSYYDNWYYERWPIDAAGVVGTREAISTIGSTNGSNSIANLKAVLDWNHAGDGATPTGPIEVFMAYMETSGSATSSVKFRKIASDAGGVWGSIGSAQSSAFSANVYTSSVTGAFVDGKFYVAGFYTTTTSYALSWDGTTFAAINPPADSGFGSLRGTALAADNDGVLHLYAAHWEASTQVTIREVVLDGGVWGAWETLDTAPVNTATIPSIYNILSVVKHRRYGGVWGVVNYDSAAYSAAGLSIAELTVFGGGWGIAI